MTDLGLESKGRRAAGEAWMDPRPLVFPRQVSNQNTHQGQSVSEAAVSKVAPAVAVLQKKKGDVLRMVTFYGHG